MRIAEARLLRVSAARLNRWLEAEEQAPDEIYRACIEIVLLQ